MKRSPGVLFLLVGIAIAAFGRPHSSASPATLSEDDFRRLEQAWLNASTPDLPALAKDPVR